MRTRFSIVRPRTNRPHLMELLSHAPSCGPNRFASRGGARRARARLHGSIDLVDSDCSPESLPRDPGTRPTRRVPLAHRRKRRTGSPSHSTPLDTRPPAAASRRGAMVYQYEGTGVNLIRADWSSAGTG